MPRPAERRPETGAWILRRTAPSLEPPEPPSRYRTQSVGLTVRTGLASALCVPLEIGGWSGEARPGQASRGVRFRSRGGTQAPKPTLALDGGTRRRRRSWEKQRKRGDAYTVGKEAADDLTGTQRRPRLAYGAEWRRRSVWPSIRPAMEGCWVRLFTQYIQESGLGKGRGCLVVEQARPIS